MSYLGDRHFSLLENGSSCRIYPGRFGLRFMVRLPQRLVGNIFSPVCQWPQQAGRLRGHPSGRLTSPRRYGKKREP